MKIREYISAFPHQYNQNNENINLIYFFEQPAWGGHCRAGAFFLLHQAGA
jgi:hypothetical protein